ncbi:hypothetical protein D3C76_1161360 [compost metagenome]
MLLVAWLETKAHGHVGLRCRLVGELVLEPGQQPLGFAMLLLGLLPGIIGLLALFGDLLSDTAQRALDAGVDIAFARA